MVLLFLLAVVAVVIAVDVVLAGVYVFGFGEQLYAPGARSPGLPAMLKLVPRAVFAWGAAGTIAVIFVVSLFNVVKLASGGAAVAEMIGARRVTPDTRDPL